MKEKRWTNLILLLAIALNGSLFLGDLVASIFTSTPFSFRFEGSPDITEKNAPTQIELNCKDTSFYIEEVYCLNANVSGNGCYESAVEWSIEDESLSYYVSANRLYFSSTQPKEATIRACSSVDNSISATFNVSFQDKAEEYLPKTYSYPTFFYSSGSSITSYIADISIAYDRPLKLNLLLQDPEHNSAFVQPTFHLTSDCYSKIDKFGNVLFDPRDIEETISGEATISTDGSNFYTKSFTFKILYPADYVSSTFGLYAGSFLLNSLPFFIAALCLSLFAEFNNYSPKKTILLQIALGTLLVGTNAGVCLLLALENLALAIATSSISFFLGAIARYVKASIHRGKRNG